MPASVETLIQYLAGGLSAACAADKALNIKDPAKAKRILPMIPPVIICCGN
jgi:hypothetical protein